MTDLFVGLAKVETMRRDFDKLRRAIRAHDPDATEAAWDKCERWLSCVSATEGVSHVARHVEKDAE